MNTYYTLEEYLRHPEDYEDTPVIELLLEKISDLESELDYKDDQIHHLQKELDYSLEENEIREDVLKKAEVKLKDLREELQELNLKINNIIPKL